MFSYPSDTAAMVSSEVTAGIFPGLLILSFSDLHVSRTNWTNGNETWEKVAKTSGHSAVREPSRGPESHFSLFSLQKAYESRCTGLD